MLWMTGWDQSVVERSRTSRVARPMKYPNLQTRPNECDEMDAEEEILLELDK